MLSQTRASRGKILTNQLASRGIDLLETLESIAIGRIIRSQRKPKNESNCFLIFYWQLLWYYLCSLLFMFDKMLSFCHALSLQHKKNVTCPIILKYCLFFVLVSNQKKKTRRRRWRHSELLTMHTLFTIIIFLLIKTFW